VWCQALSCDADAEVVRQGTTAREFTDAEVDVVPIRIRIRLDTGDQWGALLVKDEVMGCKHLPERGEGPLGDLGKCKMDSDALRIHCGNPSA
jgi:hypothetical protein